MSEILFQKDPRWANTHLGTSNYYIWAKGCTITEIAEAIGTTPDVVNQKLNNVGGFAPDANGQVSLVAWKKIEEAFPGIKINRVWSYNNDDVLAQLAAGNKVIVEVPSDPIGLPGGKHWVRYVGDHKSHDPWTGTERPTSDFPNPTGYAVISGAWQETVVEEKPVETQPETSTFHGIDLTNEASVKAAIDTWHDVATGVYVRKDEYVDLAHKICEALGIDKTAEVNTIVEHIATLKKNFKEQVLVATGLPQEQQIEGQAPPVAPAIQPDVTLANIPAHEKESLIDKLHTLENEIKALLGL
jgi:hypothetical protein